VKTKKTKISWSDYLGIDVRAEDAAARKGEKRTTAEKEDEIRLAQWVDQQRRAYKKGKLTADQIHMLELFPGWTW
jgi:hypothetical protein